MFDIYFENKYGELYENLPEKEFKVFEFKNDYGKVSHSFIKREIPLSLNDGKVYFDLVTPYGYGGPIIEHLVSSEKKEKLLLDFENAFVEYTKKNNIVSEFIRFHPLLENAYDFSNLYDITFSRKTVGTNLQYDDPFASEFSKSTKKMIRRILKNPDIRYKIEEKPENLNEFKEIYYSTMDRNDASSEYYFSDEYFNNLVRDLSDQIVITKVFLKGEVISMGLNFRYGDFLHAHLSGTLSEYLEFSPAYILKYALMIYGKENKYKYIHYGGGKGDTKSDSLFNFKKKFGKNTTFDFFMGKKIWDEPVYDLLCKEKGNVEDSNYFPLYRGNMVTK